MNIKDFIIVAAIIGVVLWGARINSFADAQAQQSPAASQYGGWELIPHASAGLGAFLYNSQTGVVFRVAPGTCPPGAEADGIPYQRSDCYVLKRVPFAVDGGLSPQSLDPMGNVIYDYQ